MAQLYWHGSSTDKRDRSKGKRYPGDTAWVQFYEDNKRRRKSLKTKDSKYAKYLVRNIENKLDESDSPFITKKINIDKIVKNFIAYSKLNITKSTLTNYENYLNNFLIQTKCSNLNKINEDLITKYIHYRIENNAWGQYSKWHFIKTIKIFLNYSVRNKYISKNPLSSMKNPKPKRLAPEYLSKKQIKSLLKAAKEEKEHKNYFVRIAIQLYSGVRPSEAGRIKLNNFNFKNKILTVPLSKTGETRRIPLKKR